MAHPEITKCYRFNLPVKEESVRKLGERLIELGYEVDVYSRKVRGVPRGLKVTIAEPSDRESRASALETLDEVFGKIAETHRVSYSVSRITRPKK